MDSGQEALSRCKAQPVVAAPRRMRGMGGVQLRNSAKEALPAIARIIFVRQALRT